MNIIQKIKYNRLLVHEKIIIDILKNCKLYKSNTNRYKDMGIVVFMYYNKLLFQKVYHKLYINETFFNELIFPKYISIIKLVEVFNWHFNEKIVVSSNLTTTSFSTLENALGLTEI